MKKRIIQSLIILAVNIVIGGLALASFSLYLFRGDTIFALLPAILALPGIILQPWFIVFFFFISGGPLFAPFLTTMISAPIFFFLDRKGKLDRVKSVLAHIRHRRAIVIASVIMMLLLLAAYARYVDFPAMYRGIPRTLHDSTKDMNLSLGNPRYFCIRSFLDSKWLWQVRLPEKDMNALANELRMLPISSDQIGDHYWSMPPYWWHPVISDQVRVFATTNFPMEGRGPDGRHALATWNPEDEVLHMWIKDNF